MREVRFFTEVARLLHEECPDSGTFPVFRNVGSPGNTLDRYLFCDADGRYVTGVCTNLETGDCFGFSSGIWQARVIAPAIPEHRRYLSTFGA